jgi:hypothetical protein
MDNFTSIGTDKLSIGKRLKMGTRTLLSLPFHIRRQYDVLDETKITVVLIRDVIDKWKSGYTQELNDKFEHGTNLFNFVEHFDNLNPSALRRFWQRLKYGYYTTFTNPGGCTKVGLEIISKLHDYYADLSWIHYSHAEFWMWNDDYHESLWELSLKPNVYFLDLKDLSNPKFLEWLQERDEDWKQVKKMPHKNQTLENFWPQMELLWKEYNEGKILKGKILVSPFFETKLPDFIDGKEFTYREIDSETKLKFAVHLKLCKFHQDSVDYIRDSHERYLKFDV